MPNGLGLEIRSGAEAFADADWQGLDTGGAPFVSWAFLAPPRRPAPPARTWAGGPCIRLYGMAGATWPASCLYTCAIIPSVIFPTTGVGPWSGGNWAWTSTSSFRWKCEFAGWVGKLPFVPELG